MAAITVRSVPWMTCDLSPMASTRSTMWAIWVALAPFSITTIIENSSCLSVAVAVVSMVQRP